MENVTYYLNISAQTVTDVNITDGTVTDITVMETESMRTDATNNETSTIELNETTNSILWSTGFDIFNVTDSYETTVAFWNQTILTTQSYDENEEFFDYGDKYMYPVYTFEQPFYLYFWEIVVIFTFLFNLVVISVLLRKNMRNPTNVVLTAIAVSDSLTGLVTLPSYIMVYQKYFSVETGYDNYDNYDEYDYSLNYTYNEQSVPAQYTNGSGVGAQPNQEQEAVGGCELTKDLCNGFMVSKYFLSKSFHSMSIFLTLFLGIHRYISIRYPYRSQLLLTLPKTAICCLAVVFLSPILHVYHLVGERAAGGLCQWELKEKGCGRGCIYLWMAFFIRHLIPCVTLVVFTTLFILQLQSGERNLRRMDSSKSQISRRKDENRRISVIVTAVVIVFLIPEIPYVIFLLYNAIDKAANQGRGIALETNRAIQLVYELLLVLSFHANFYIYTFFNRRFRKTLYRTYLKPFRRLFGDTDRLSVSQTSSTSHRPSKRKTDTGSAVTKIEMEPMMKNTSPSQSVRKTNSAVSGLLEKDPKIIEGGLSTDI